MKKNNQLSPWQRVYVNRSLNMANIKAIGFDMDHTLALYKREEFEKLAFEKALDKFIQSGYPKELANLKFDPEFIIRGLLVDIENGNLLKVDCHKYVKLAYHGHKKLTKQERNRLYNQQSFKAENFRTVDTFFALSEIQLYAEIVDYMNRNPKQITKSLKEVYYDIKSSIDLSHRDGSIKNEVVSNLSKYVVKDPQLKDVLAMLKESGKTLFLITNSHWDYTTHILSFLLNDTKLQKRWEDYFDYVIVGSNKPAFFSGKQPFYEVIPESGHLKTTNAPLSHGKMYHGGNASLLEKMLNVKGDEILYVGDHIFGDIIHSKGKFNWRTMLVVDELESELRNLSASSKNFDDIKKQSSMRESLDEELNTLIQNHSDIKAQIASGDNLADYKKRALEDKEKKLSQNIENITYKIRDIDKKIDLLSDKRSLVFHATWGELLRTGLEPSRFADQIMNYACVYTSKVTNLFYYNPFKKFHSSKNKLPHEF